VGVEGGVGGGDWMVRTEVMLATVSSPTRSE